MDRVDQTILKTLYHKVCLIRKTEEAIQREYFSNEMKTPVHLSLGSEGIVAGVCQELTDKDQVLGTFRSHALYLAKTLETDKFFAELYGRVDGMAKGKGGSMHLSCFENGVMTSSSILATNIPVATGLAFANKVKKNGSIVACFFGDGATEEGTFWESINIACLMKLPIIFICEDNELAVHTLPQQRRGYSSLASIVNAFDCEVLTSESTQADEIYHLTCKARNIVELEKKPVLMLLKYYRYMEHVGTNDDLDAPYRNKKDFAEWKLRDPFDTLRTKTINVCGIDEVQEIEGEIVAQIENSIIKAKKMLFPSKKELFKDVLC